VFESRKRHHIPLKSFRRCEVGAFCGLPAALCRIAGVEPCVCAESHSFPDLVRICAMALEPMSCLGHHQRFIPETFSNIGVKRGLRSRIAP